jgi:zinc finger MYND domain-containing protein 10
MTDYLKYLPVSVCHNIMVESDLLCALVPLIEDKPWLRTNFREEREIFENNKWTIVPKSEYSTLPKIEGNVWITIYNLFMDPECRKKYELNEYRKNNLLRVRKKKQSLFCC